MAEIDELLQTAREEEGGRAMTTEPEPERWATFQSAPPKAAEEPEVAPGMDDASRWAAGLEADKRGEVQDAFAVRAITDAGKALINSAVEDAVSDTGSAGDTGGAEDTGGDIPPEWFQWIGEEAGDTVKEALVLGGVATPFARALYRRTAMGSAPTTPYTPYLRGIGRPTVNPAFAETIKLGRHAAGHTRWASGGRGVAQRIAHGVGTAAPAAAAAAPVAGAVTGGLIGFYNFGRGVKKIFDDDPATDMKDHSFKYLQRPLGPRDYLADSREMKYLRANPDAAAALHAAGVLSDSMLGHLATEEE